MTSFEKYRNELKENGFAVVNSEFLNKDLNLLRKKFYSDNSIFYKKVGGTEINSDSDIIAFHKNYGQQQFNVWKVFQFAPMLYHVGGNTDLLDLLSNIGITTPTLDLPPQLRCDMPIEGQSIFLRHQDYSYNIGSEDSVTVWTPLQDTGKKEGCLLVVPGSHKNGVYKHEKGIISDEIKFDFVNQEVLFGQSLIFNQKLVHQSGFNTSDKIRFSLQLRFSNLDAADYLDRDWYKNHKTVVQKFA